MATRKEIRAVFGAESNVTDTEIKSLLDLIHSETDSIRDERDQLREQLTAANKAVETANGERDKANKDFEDYKALQAAEKTNATKRTAYKNLLATAGITEKWQDKIVKFVDLEGITLNADGTVRNAEKVVDSIKSEYADYISVSGTSGANVETPPGNSNGKAAFDAMTLTEKMAFANTHPAEYAEYSKT